MITFPLLRHDCCFPHICFFRSCVFKRYRFPKRKFGEIIRKLTNIDVSDFYESLYWNHIWLSGNTIQHHPTPVIEQYLHNKASKHTCVKWTSWSERYISELGVVLARNRVYFQKCGGSGGCRSSGCPTGRRTPGSETTKPPFRKVSVIQQERLSSTTLVSN